MPDSKRLRVLLVGLVGAVINLTLLLFNDGGRWNVAGVGLAGVGMVMAVARPYVIRDHTPGRP